MPGASIDHQRKRLIVSQSALATHQRCPEQFRQELLRPIRRHNDALACGSAVHLHAEHRLLGHTYATAYARAYDWLDAEWQREDFQFVKVAKPETMFAHFDACVTGWEAHVLRQLPADGSVETTLSFPLGEPDADGWEILLEGTPDYVADGIVWDWKTSASEYNAYEAALWNVQPSAYTYLASRATGVEHNDFCYAVMVKPHGTVQVLDVERGPAEWAWLHRIAQGLLYMTRTMLDQPWPVVHTHYLCDPKWCPAWDECRGPYVNGEHNTEVQLTRRMARA